MLINDLQRATQKSRNNASFKKVIGNIGGGSSSKFDKSSGVLVRGGFRKHRGSGSKPQASSKMNAHLKYLAGDKHKLAEKEKRDLYDDKGHKIESEKAQETHKDAFIEHRIVISPAGDKTTEHDLHILSQAMIAEVRERNPAAEVSASYAIHQDTKHTHSHVLITSPNVVKLDKEFYGEMRQEMKELKAVLDNEKERSFSWSQDIFKEKQQQNDMEISL